MSLCVGAPRFEGLVVRGAEEDMYKHEDVGKDTRTH